MNLNSELIVLLIFGFVLFVVMILVMSFLISVFFHWLDERSAEFEEEDDVT